MSIVYGFNYFGKKFFCAMIDVWQSSKYVSEWLRDRLEVLHLLLSEFKWIDKILFH